MEVEQPPRKVTVELSELEEVDLYSDGQHRDQSTEEFEETSEVDEASSPYFFKHHDDAQFTVYSATDMSSSVMFSEGGSWRIAVASWLDRFLCVACRFRYPLIFGALVGKGSWAIRKLRRLCEKEIVPLPSSLATAVPSVINVAVSQVQTVAHQRTSAETTNLMRHVVESMQQARVAIPKPIENIVRMMLEFQGVTTVAMRQAQEQQAVVSGSLSRSQTLNPPAPLPCSVEPHTVPMTGDADMSPNQPPFAVLLPIASAVVLMAVKLVVAKHSRSLPEPSDDYLNNSNHNSSSSRHTAECYVERDPGTSLEQDLKLQLEQARAALSVSVATSPQSRLHVPKLSALHQHQFLSSDLHNESASPRDAFGDNGTPRSTASSEPTHGVRIADRSRVTPRTTMLRNNADALTASIQRKAYSLGVTSTRSMTNHLAQGADVCDDKGFVDGEVTVATSPSTPRGGVQPIPELNEHFVDAPQRITTLDVISPSRLALSSESTTSSPEMLSPAIYQAPTGSSWAKQQGVGVGVDSLSTALLPAVPEPIRNTTAPRSAKATGSIIVALTGPATMLEIKAVLSCCARHGISHLVITNRDDRDSSISRPGTQQVIQQLSPDVLVEFISDALPYCVALSKEWSVPLIGISCFELPAGLTSVALHEATNWTPECILCVDPRHVEASQHRLRLLPAGADEEHCQWVHVADDRHVVDQGLAALVKVVLLTRRKRLGAAVVTTR